jgi:hypothetical protein
MEPTDLTIEILKDIRGELKDIREEGRRRRSASSESSAGKSSARGIQCLGQIPRREPGPVSRT